MTNNNALTATKIDDTTFTLDVTLGGETRTVEFWSMGNSAYGKASDDVAGAICTGHGNKVWPTALCVWRNAGGTYRLAQDYGRLNRNGYRLIGWFSKVAKAANTSRHNSTQAF